MAAIPYPSNSAIEQA